MPDEETGIFTDDEIQARLALGERFGDEREERRLAEMRKGRQTLLRNIAVDALSKCCNPDYRDGNEGARPSPENKAYRERMQRQVRDE